MRAHRLCLLISVVMAVSCQVEFQEKSKSGKKETAMPSESERGSDQADAGAPEQDCEKDSMPCDQEFESQMLSADIGADKDDKNGDKRKAWLEKIIDRLFERFDADKDGKFSREELTELVQRFRKLFHRHWFSRWLAKDREGQQSAQGHRDPHPGDQGDQRGPPPYERPGFDALLKCLDKDGDGKLSRDEHQRMREPEARECVHKEVKNARPKDQQQKPAEEPAAPSR